jgi:LysM repeat protein
VRIPEDKKDVFLKNLSLIPEEKRFSIDTYTVRKGDTFKKISKKTGIPVQVILDLNSLEKIIPLKDGMEIYLPPKGKFVLDRDDRAAIKKASFKSKKSFTKKRSSRAKGLKKVSSKGKHKGLKTQSRKA